MSDNESNKLLVTDISGRFRRDSSKPLSAIPEDSRVEIAFSLYKKTVTANTYRNTGMPIVSLMADLKQQQRRIIGLKNTLRFIPTIWFTTVNEEIYKNWDLFVFSVFSHIETRLTKGAYNACKLLNDSFIPFNRHVKIFATLYGTTASYRSTHDEIVRPGDMYSLLEDYDIAGIAINVISSLREIKFPLSDDDFVREDELTARIVEELLHLTTSFLVVLLTENIQARFTINETLAELVMQDLGVINIPDEKKTQPPLQNLSAKITEVWRELEKECTGRNHVYLKLSGVLKKLSELLAECEIEIKSPTILTFNKTIERLDSESEKSVNLAVLSELMS